MVEYTPRTKKSGFVPIIEKKTELCCTSCTRCYPIDKLDGNGNCPSCASNSYEVKKIEEVTTPTEPTTHTQPAVINIYAATPHPTTQPTPTLADDKLEEILERLEKIENKPVATPAIAPKPEEAAKPSGTAKQTSGEKETPSDKELTRTDKLYKSLTDAIERMTPPASVKEEGKTSLAAWVAKATGKEIFNAWKAWSIGVAKVAGLTAALTFAVKSVPFLNPTQEEPLEAAAKVFVRINLYGQRPVFWLAGNALQIPGLFLEYVPSLTNLASAFHKQYNLPTSPDERLKIAHETEQILTQYGKRANMGLLYDKIQSIIAKGTNAEDSKRILESIVMNEEKYNKAIADSIEDNLIEFDDDKGVYEGVYSRFLHFTKDADQYIFVYDEIDPRTSQLIDESMRSASVATSAGTTPPAVIAITDKLREFTELFHVYIIHGSGEHKATHIQDEGLTGTATYFRKWDKNGKEVPALELAPYGERIKGISKKEQEKAQEAYDMAHLLLQETK